ncbi:FkbM family methyltransferase [Saccharopolyspora erythraea NRRL 2338]|uniref:Non-ribosomal peptide synthetase n=2 Tax=Saccharopolyspora erythraea TaxID=1836 RepID=A4FJ89_SACEN|nr:FkbM family methyltransferase [Saccharopolyspora erythraea]EQD82935.1 peptide synthetase [Saccharopolyspora erythraea D]PFG97785.1 FkbM family methyltransferase [Saccharopolyspora erythraea NRRL 2338]QRK87928.1 FkbM family methyltransferase [Saccharopolyspora erythraea]CAM04114.1 putative non-ribosomal peptide synthetase [Saccharopolyspora erythraea NRRL 2338]
MDNYTAAPTSDLTLPDGRVVTCVNARNAGLVWQEIRTDCYRLDLLDIPAGGSIIDVGAHIGLFSLFAAERIPGVRLISCEPAPATFACLAANLTAFAPNATALNTAVGEQPGSAELTYYPDAEAMTTLETDDEDDRSNIAAVASNLGIADSVHDYVQTFSRRTERYTVPVTTIDRIIADHDLGRVDLLKIDVERAEPAVLRGITDDNWPKIHNVAVEVHDIHGRLSEVVTLLEQRDYRVEALQEDMYRGSSVHIVLASRT